MRLTRTIAPELLPVSLEEGRAQCRVNHSHEDDLISGLIASAVGKLDGPSGILGRVIMEQTWSLELPGPWPDRLTLPLDPVISVEVSYLDSTGGTVVLDVERVDLVRYPSMPVELRFVGDGAMPVLGSGDWPIQIEIVAGFGAEALSVPSEIRTAIKMMVEHWYDNRSVVTDRQMYPVPLTADALLAGWRVLL